MLNAQLESASVVVYVFLFHEGLERMDTVSNVGSIVGSSIHGCKGCCLLAVADDDSGSLFVVVLL